MREVDTAQVPQWLDSRPAGLAALIGDGSRPNAIGTGAAPAFLRAPVPRGRWELEELALTYERTPEESAIR